MPDSAGSMRAETIVTLSVRYTPGLTDRGDRHLDRSAPGPLLEAAR
jgi:hypothetical protein